MMETVDAAHMRATNSSILLKLIWKNREISRADISRLTGMSRSTVSAIVADLMRRGLVSESGIGHSNGGRRPVILSFNENAYSLLGFELSVDAIRAVLLNLNGHVQLQLQRECDVLNDPKATLSLIDGIIDEVQAFCEAENRPLIGVGVGVPAPLLASDAEPFLKSIFPAWQEYSLFDYLESRLAVPVRFENDANLGALAERWWGVGHSSDNLICIKMGHSVGAGLIIDGKIHQGSRGLAGEVGQMLVQLPQGGQKGRTLVESLGSRALSAAYRARCEAEGNGKSPESAHFAGLVAAAEAGEAAALAVLDEAAVTLGQVVINLLAVLDSEKVVISSSCPARLRERLTARLKQTVLEQRPFGALHEPEIIESPLGEQQVAIGAATLILDMALNDLRLFQPLQLHASVERQWSEESALESSPN